MPNFAFPCSSMRQQAFCLPANHPFTQYKVTKLSINTTTTTTNSVKICLRNNIELSSYKSAFSSNSNLKLRLALARKSSLPTSIHRTLAVDVTAKNVCIVNTNGGGHAVMGFYLAKELQASGHTVTICTVGEENSGKMNKPPFTSFDQLRSAGVSTVWGDAPSLDLGNFDVVIDNNGKTLDTVKPNVDWAQAMGSKQFIFVSSAGMYRPSNMLPVTEEDPVKETAGHAEVEAYVAGLEGIHFSSFRPQYMMGHLNNKDCEEYFFDRLVRGRPVLIPGSGDQITNIANAEDNAHMIALATHNKAAYGQIFNCVRDKGVTLDGWVQLCAAAAGVEPLMVHYDPKAYDINAKKAFPFRTEYHFFCEPRNAMMLLGWKPAGDLFTDLLARFEKYKESERFSEEMSFEMDDEILKLIHPEVDEK